ncbi:peptide chain release factor 1 [Candidatus Woesearchaeota archaeon]|nr:peptide chain release factor 1 [Candidatus Woesearchaeota archaeon]
MSFMALTAHQRFELKKVIKELDSFRAAHTEFVSVYIPAGYDINKIINHLAQEQGTASNIKSASTRNNVISALERMIQHLKLFKKTPPNGLAIFSGNVLSREGKSDVRVWSVEPPVPLNTRIYKCDKTFELGILRDMVDVKDMYGLVVMDARDANIALLKGKRIVPLLKTHSHVPGKMKAGGQSSHRFQANRDLAVKEHLKKVADYMKEQFLGREDVKGILVGGPGPNKHDLVEGNFITGDVKKKIIAVKDLSYTGDFGLQELVDKCQDVLAQEEIADEKKVMGEFFNFLSTKQDMVAYGENQVRMALSMGAVETLLLSESLDDDTIDEFDELARKFSTVVKIISTETREGVQLRDIGKIAAILRYPVNV